MEQPAGGPAVRCSARRDGDDIIVCVAGEVDLLSVADVERSVCAAAVLARRAVVLDLSDVRFLDLADARALLACREVVRAAGRRFGVGNLSHAAWLVFEHGGFGALLTNGDRGAVTHGEPFR